MDVSLKGISCKFFFPQKFAWKGKFFTPKFFVTLKCTNINSTTIKYQLTNFAVLITDKHPFGHVVWKRAWFVGGTCYFHLRFSAIQNTVEIIEIGLSMVDPDISNWMLLVVWNQKLFVPNENDKIASQQ